MVVVSVLGGTLSVERHPEVLLLFEIVSMGGSWPLLGAMRAPPKPRDAFEPSLCRAGLRGSERGALWW